MAQGKKGERKGRRDGEDEEDTVKRSNRFPLVPLGIENERATERSYKAKHNMNHGPYKPGHTVPKLMD